MATRLAAVLGLAAMLALGACSSATSTASQSSGNQATASGGSTPGSSASGNQPTAGSAATTSCKARPDDALMLTLVPATITVKGESIVLKRYMDPAAKTQAYLDSMAHSLPGIDVSTLNCLRWIYGTGYSAKGYQTTITVYLAPDGSGVSGADLAAAAKRRWTKSTEWTCQAGALSDLDCDGGFVSHTSSGKAGIEVLSGDATANVVAIAQQIAAGI